MRSSVFFIVLWSIVECFAASTQNEDSLTPTGYFGQHELCEHEIARVERQYNIPHGLFMAIGTVESGRSVTSRGKRPWPWTLCVNGKSYYCSTKSAAIATAKRLIARGVRNIDVGCMQVNLLHHSKAFKSLSEAFTPKHNVEYAAKFFSQLRNTYSSWTHAVGYYHSKTPKFYKKYCKNVYNAWEKARNFTVRSTPKIQQASRDIKSNIPFMPSFYSLMDRSMTAKLHRLGRQSLKHRPPKFLIESK